MKIKYLLISFFSFILVSQTESEMFSCYFSNILPNHLPNASQTPPGWYHSYQDYIEDHFAKNETKIDLRSISAWRLRGKINLNQYTRLETLILDNNPDILGLDITNCWRLKTFSYNGYIAEIPVINFSQNIKLERVSLVNVNLRLNYELDFSQHYRLQYLNLDSNKAKNWPVELALFLPYNYTPSFFSYKNRDSQLKIQHLYQNKNMGSPEKWSLHIYENKVQKVGLINYRSYLTINGDIFYRPSEDWALNEHSAMRIAGLKNWFDFDKDVTHDRGQGTEWFSRFFYWTYTGWWGYTWIVPIWYEANIITSAQQWLNQQDKDAIELDAFNLGLTGDADFSRFKKLEIINFYHNQIKSINVSKNRYLWKLYFNDNIMSNIDVSNNSDLYILHVENNRPHSFVHLHWQFYQHWYFFYHDEDSVILQDKQPVINGQEWVDKQDWHAFSLTGANLKLEGPVDFQDFEQLKILYLFNNQLTIIDVSRCTDLFALLVKDNPYLRKIILPDNFSRKERGSFEYDHDHYIELVGGKE